MQSHLSSLKVNTTEIHWKKMLMTEQYIAKLMKILEGKIK